MIDYPYVRICFMDKVNHYFGNVPLRKVMNLSVKMFVEILREEGFEEEFLKPSDKEHRRNMKDILDTPFKHLVGDVFILEKWPNQIDEGEDTMWAFFCNSHYLDREYGGRFTAKFSRNVTREK